MTHILPEIDHWTDYAPASCWGKGWAQILRGTEAWDWPGTRIAKLEMLQHNVLQRRSDFRLDRQTALMEAPQSQPMFLGPIIKKLRKTLETSWKSMLSCRQSFKQADDYHGSALASTSPHHSWLYETYFLPASSKGNTVRFGGSISFSRVQTRLHSDLRLNFVLPRRSSRVCTTPLAQLSQCFWNH